jgi:hypothetical protein
MARTTVHLGTSPAGSIHPYCVWLVISMGLVRIIEMPFERAERSENVSGAE